VSKYAVLLAVAMIAGCGGNRPATQPVSGKVVFADGKPVKGATVKFRATNQTPPFTASGKTDDQGHFGFDAAEGENSAVVVPTFPNDTDNMSAAERDRAMNPIDATFLEYDTSPLKFQVGTDPSKNQFELKVWPPRR
jgi:hypothetical protein